MRARQVQFALLRSLWDKGVTAEAEVRLPARSTKSRADKFLADVVVFKGGRPVAAIECKGYEGPPKGLRQRENYELCGIPAVWCGPATIPDVVARFAP